MKDKEGRLLTNPNEQFKRGTECFEKTPKRFALVEPLLAETLFQISTDIPSKEEIRKVVVKLKNGQFPGPDAIAPEAVRDVSEAPVNLQ